MQTMQAGIQAMWKQVYQEALFEHDPARLPEKLAAAHQAIAERFSYLCNSDCNRHELTQLEDANRIIVLLLRSLGQADA